MSSQPMYVAFCHPDLGLGGAERLVVDAALELKARGHRVDIFTAHHDPERCFEETRDGSLNPIRVHGDWLPRHLFGKFHALCASLRCLWLCLVMCFSGIHFDAVFVDQVSTVLPVIKLFRRRWRTVFYCHYPDLLLSKKRGFWKQLYRWPLDTMEQWSTGWADEILVNSEFTAQVFARTFARLHQRGIRPRVLHPAVSIPSRDVLDDAARAWRGELRPEIVEFLRRPNSTTFLSINRYERKKKVNRAIEALAALIPRVTPGQRPQLIIAGGYDERVTENQEVLQELQSLVRNQDLGDRVFFIRSFTDREKHLLLSTAAAVVYTPEDEHFGIVPLESMAFERPVIACNSGGPVESTVHDQTGMLVPPTAVGFATAMLQLQMMSPEERQRMGDQGRQHVLENFSRARFGEVLEGVLVELVNKKGQ